MPMSAHASTEQAVILPEMQSMAVPSPGRSLVQLRDFEPWTGLKLYELFGEWGIAMDARLRDGYRDGNASRAGL